MTGICTPWMAARPTFSEIETDLSPQKDRQSSDRNVRDKERGGDDDPAGRRISPPPSPAGPTQGEGHAGEVIPPCEVCREYASCGGRCEGRRLEPGETWTPESRLPGCFTPIGDLCGPGQFNPATGDEIG